MSIILRHQLNIFLFILVSLAASSAVAQGSGSGDLWNNIETQESSEQESDEASSEEQNDEAQESTETSDDKDSSTDSKPPTTKSTNGSSEPRFNRALSGMDLEGGLGFHHFAVAKPGRAKTFRIGLAGTFSHGSNVIRANDENTLIAGDFLFQAMITEYFSVNTGLKGRNNTNTFSRPRSMLSQGDWHLGVRGHYEMSPGLYFAGDLTGYFPAAYEGAGLELGAVSLRPRMSLSYYGNEGTKTAPDDRGLIATFNLGYRLDGTSNLAPDGINVSRVERVAQSISEYDSVELGAAIAYQVDNFRPYGGFRIDVPVNPATGVCAEEQPLPCISNSGFAALPKWASLGITATPLDRLALFTGVDLSLTTGDSQGLPVTLPYKLLLGASWTIDPDPPDPAPDVAYLKATVLDKSNGQPVEDATIRYTGKGVKKNPQTTDSAGEFTTYDFPLGQKVELQISHSSYGQKAVAKKVVKNVKPFEIELEPKPAKTTITGKVVDASGNSMGGVTLKLSGGQTETIPVAADGRFQKEVSPGRYQIQSGSDKYETQVGSIELKKDRVHYLRVRLQKKVIEVGAAKVKDGKIKLSGDITFESEEAKLAGQSKRLLDDVAELLKSNPGLGRIRIDGHTDDRGSEDEKMQLSTERARRVRDYLVNQGVSSDRLETKGFGGSQPLVPNFTEENRELNRRIEFTVLK